MTSFNSFLSASGDFIAAANGQVPDDSWYRLDETQAQAAFAAGYVRLRMRPSSRPLQRPRPWAACADRGTCRSAGFGPALVNRMPLRVPAAFKPGALRKFQRPSQGLPARAAEPPPAKDQAR